MASVIPMPSAVVPPLSSTQQALDAWHKLVDENISRMGKLYQELARIEGRSIEQMGQSIDEMAKVLKESFSYASQYSSEWRRVTLETARRTAELLTPRL